MDRLTSITNPMGEEEAVYAYDHAGRILRYREQKDAPASIYTYNHAGWLVSLRKPMEEVEDGSIRYRLTTYEYDDMGNRTVEKRYLDYQTEDSAAGRTNVISYTYNSSNLLVKVTDSTGACMEYFHDNAGRCIRELVKLSEGTGQEIRYVLDETGRVRKRFEKLETDAVSPAGTG